MMKISAINNNNYSVLQKVYFKQNAEFYKLCDRSLSWLNSDLLEKFKKLPNHEIEFLEVKNLHFSTNKMIGLFNHKTKKSKDFEVQMGNPLKNLIEELCSLSSTGFFLEDCT